MKASNVRQDASFQILTAGANVSLPTTGPSQAPYYINIHNDAGSSDTVYISPDGSSNYNFAVATIPPLNGIAVRPDESITLGPVYGTNDPLQITPDLVGGGNCTVNVNYSPAVSFGPFIRRRTKSVQVNEGAWRLADSANDTRIKPYKEQNYWLGDTPAYFNVFLEPNGAAPADYKVFIVQPDSTDTTSGIAVGLEESVTVGPFTKDNAPDIFVPAVAGTQLIDFSYTPVTDGGHNPDAVPLDFKYEHNIVQDISNSGPATDIEMYLNMDEAPGSTLAHNFANGVNIPMVNGPTLQSDGIDGWGINLDGVNQALQSTPGTFPFNQGQTSNYSMSFWIKPEAYPGNPGYAGLDAVPYVISNTNVPFGPRWGFVVLLSSAISAYGVDGAVVYQPRHGASSFGAGTGFRNTSPEFLCTVGNWHHVAINRDIVSGIEIWVNGQLAVSDPFNETSANTSAGDITIGCRGNEGAATFNNRNTFQGNIDEFVLLNRTLSPAEITALFEAGAPT